MSATIVKDIWVDQLIPRFGYYFTTNNIHFKNQRFVMTLDNFLNIRLEAGRSAGFGK